MVGYSLTHDLIGLQRTVQKAEALSIELDTLAVNHLLLYYEQEEIVDWEKLVEIYDKYFFTSTKVKASHFTYIILLDACKKLNRPNDAVYLFDKMLVEKLVPIKVLLDSLKGVLGEERYSNYKFGV